MTPPHLFLLLPAAAFAQEVFGPSLGPAREVRAAPAFARAEITEGLLACMNINMESYQTLSRCEKLAIQREISLRLLRIEKLRELKGEEGGASYISPDRCLELTDEGSAILKENGFVEPALEPACPRETAAARTDAPSRVPSLQAFDLEPVRAKLQQRFFDGTPMLESEGIDPNDVSWSLDIRNLQPKSFRFQYKPWNVEVEAGQIALEGDRWNALMDTSQYIQFTKRFYNFDDQNRWFDRWGGWRLGVLRETARYFDPSIDNFSGAARTMDILQSLGVPGMPQMKSSFADQDRYKTGYFPYGSAILQGGKAFNLFGLPLDVGLLATNATEVWGPIPNIAFDGTAALRWRWKKDQSAAVMAGVTENFSIVQDSMILQPVFKDPVTAPAIGIGMETSPWAGVSFWGKVFGDMRYDLSGRVQRNQWTQTQMVRAALQGQAWGRAMQLAAMLRSERGDAIEFQNDDYIVQASYRLLDWLNLTAAYKHQKVRMGFDPETGATQEGDVVMGGISIPLETARGSVNMDWTTYNQTISAPLTRLDKASRAVSQFGAEAVDFMKASDDAFKKNRGSMTAAKVEKFLTDWAKRAEAWSPEMRQAFAQEIDQFNLTPAQKDLIVKHFVQDAAPILGIANPSEAVVRETLELGEPQLKRTMIDLVTGDSSKCHITRNDLVDRLKASLPEPVMTQAANLWGSDLTGLIPANLEVPPVVGHAAAGNVVPICADDVRRELEKRYDAARPKVLAAIRDAAPKLVNALGQGSDYFNKHEAEIRELVTLLGNSDTWTAFALRYGKNIAIQEMREVGFSVKVGGVKVSMQLDAPTMLIGVAALRARLNPYAPIRSHEAGDLLNPFLRREVNKAVGLDKDASLNQLGDRLVDRFYQETRGAFDKALGESLRGAAASQTRQELVDKALSSLSKDTAAELRAKYGGDLSGLIPAGEPEELRKLLIEKLPDELVKDLKARYGDDIASGLGQAFDYASRQMARLINRALLDQFMAAQALRPLSLLGDLRPGDHAQSGITTLFDNQTRDEQRGGSYKEFMRGVIRRMQESPEFQEIATEVRETPKSLGKKYLKHRELQPEYPSNLEVEVHDDQWESLVAVYGDELWRLIRGFEAELERTGYEKELEIELSYDPTARGHYFPSGKRKLEYKLPYTYVDPRIKRDPKDPIYAAALAEARRANVEAVLADLRAKLASR